MGVCLLFIGPSAGLRLSTRPLLSDRGPRLFLPRFPKGLRFDPCRHAAANLSSKRELLHTVVAALKTDGSLQSKTLALRSGLVYMISSCPKFKLVPPLLFFFFFNYAVLKQVSTANETLS